MPPTPVVFPEWLLFLELVGRLVDRDGNDSTARPFGVTVRAELERAEEAVLDVLGEHLRDHVAA